MRDGLKDSRPACDEAHRWCAPALPAWILVVAAVGLSYACAGRHVTAPTPPRDDAAIIGDLRALAQSEAVYQAANFGFYDVPACVATPARCIPWYQRTEASVPPPSAELVARRHGYLWRFSPGRAPLRESLPEDASRSSLLEWAYTAVPTSKESDAPAYCVDHTRRICRYASRAALRRPRGACPEPCQRVE